MQAFLALALLIASIVCALAAFRGAGAPEFWYTLATIALMADTFVVQRARVLTIPFFFILCIVLLFWSARRSAEREDAEEEG